jgi:ATP-dependent Lon protease
MEVIRLSGYIAEEKARIAARYIVPRAHAENGLPAKFVRLTKAALLAIADRYAREAGVRNLAKQIGKIMRRTAYAYAGDRTLAPRVIDADDLVPYLGEPVFRGEQARKLDEPGLALGLAWTSLGGEVLTIESLANPGKGGLKLTGKLGEVMSESAAIAYSYAMRIALAEGVPQEYFETHQIHLHVPSGATPKDGPSAGITMASALLSLVFGKKISRRLAMTGELSLSGDVLPIGGLKEKVIAAKRSGIREVILPATNKADLEEIPQHIRKGILFHLVDRMEQVKELAF